MRLRHQARRARPIADPEWVAALHRAAHQVGSIESVTLLAGGNFSVPVTCGVLRPSLLMPNEALRWSAERRHMILLHELAHVKRRDTLTQILGQFACAVFWFSPLVWLAARNMRSQREQACDEIVLRSGVVPSSYARQLLDILRSSNSGVEPAYGAIPAVSAREFEGRMRSLLRPGPRPLRVGVLGSCILAAWSLPVSLLLGFARPVVAGPSPLKANGPASCTIREDGVLDVTLGSPRDGQVANVGAQSGPKVVLGVFDGKECLAAVITGSVSLSADLSDVSAVARGGSLSLVDLASPAGPRVHVTERNGGISRRYQIGGTDASWHEGQKWFAEALAYAVRDNGYDASSRVKTLLAQRGVDSIVEEVQRSRTDPGKRKLLLALLGQVALAAPDRERVARVATAMRSQSDREAVLNALARQKGPK
jgi:hypothetical protein